MANGNNPPTCPSCGRRMVLRTARNGRFAGSQFYGCSGYPNCKKIINIDWQPTHTTNTTNHTQDEVSDFVQNLIAESIKEEIRIPQMVHCKSKSNYQVKLFQNTWTLPEIIPEIYKNRRELNAKELAAFAQWRLDYPRPKKIIDSKLDPPISVLEKILFRGLILPCSPNVREKISNLFPDTDIDVDTYLQLMQNVERHPRNWQENVVFDSDAEETFFANIQSLFDSKNDIRPWIFPQASYENLIETQPNQISNQRVDFLFSHPKIDDFIVEIDGPQHDDSMDADRRRDAALANAGFNVFRITTDQQMDNTFRWPNELQQLFIQFKQYSPLDPEADPALRLLLFLKEAYQIQVSLLQAVKDGVLDFEQTLLDIHVLPSQWVRDLRLFDQIVRIAIDDFFNTLQMVMKLYGINIDAIQYNLVQRSELHTADMIICFDPDLVQEQINPFIYYISDIYFPSKISQPVPNASPVRIENPSKEAVEYFLQYIFFKDKGFREGQWEAIQRTLQGKDSIVLLPTGGGKTIAFQLAAFLLPGVTLVIDPLIALINDQVSNLRSDYGIDRAIGISSQLDQENRVAALDSFSRGHYLFCYVAPERLQMQDFRDAIRSVTVFAPINAVVIDEAHCVSEWGHDFRVSYLNIARNARDYCKKEGAIPPILGLTGTASRSVLRDVRRELEITEFDSVITPKSFDRSELKFKILFCKSNEKFDRLKGVITALPNNFRLSPNNFFVPQGKLSNTGLIFFPWVNGSFGIMEGFKKVKSYVGDVVRFYSGKSPKNIPENKWQDIKTKNAEKFKTNETTILTCTNAFGMGIDKPNIRYTVHINIPRSIEAFYQEAGRAGRDGDPAICTLIVSNDYPNRTQALLDPGKPLSEISNAVENIGYGEGDDISRALFFHVNTFKGAQEEFQEVIKLLDKFGNVNEEKELKIPFNGNRTNIEKAVHRLVIIGVIRDYTINYSSEEISLVLSGNSMEENLESYYRYIANYDRKFAQQARKVVLERDFLSQREFILFLAEKLIHEFIYNIIELGRRRSLREMLDACISNTTDEGIRSRILSYLELGQFSEILDTAREEPEKLAQIIEKIVSEIDSPMEANELRGQTARMLEAYPNNPAFLLIRSLAEIYCPDRNTETVTENFNAFLSFSTSESGWGIDNREVLEIVINFIQLIGFQFHAIAEEILVAAIEFFGDDRNIARFLISNLEEQYCLYPSNILLDRLQKQVSNIV